MGTANRDALLCFASHGDRPVLCAPGETFDARAVRERIAAVVTGLRGRGVQPGDRVALLGSTTPATVLALLGALACGAVVVPLNPRHRENELGHVVRDSSAALAIVDPPLAGPLAAAVPGLLHVDVHALVRGPASALDLPEIDDDEIALSIYTSGTTGPSKGVDLSMRSVVGNARAVGALWKISDGDILALALPLFHVHGLCVALVDALLHGATVRLHARFEPAAIVADFAHAGATVFMGVPTMYVQLLEHLERVPAAAAALARARLFTAGSAALSPSVLERFAALTDHRILERYGMTETLITLSNPLEGERRSGSVGMPLPGAAIRIVGDDDRPVDVGQAGELLVRAPWLMHGYHGQPDATARAFVDGWFRTGDVAVADPDGYVRIVGRTSTDIVKTGGFKVSTREIEDVIG
ncbi:MAG TPA: AMP-binding protein, partial [Nannocystaceae bacterium]|nr:AMP-binding protein [Nannocystaceae bacterium]